MPASIPSAEAALEAGDRILLALNADDLDGVLDAARDRGALVAELVRSGVRPTPGLAERFRRQDQTLAERLAHAYDTLAEALRQSGRARHAAGQYAGGAPRRARLQAEG